MAAVTSGRRSEMSLWNPEAPVLMALAEGFGNMCDTPSVSYHQRAQVLDAPTPAAEDLRFIHTNTHTETQTHDVDAD